MPDALLIHGLSNAPASMWRFRGWLEELGWTVRDHSPLGHAGRGAAPDYALDSQVGDALATGAWDLVIGHSLGGAIATAAAAREPGWTRRLVAVDPAWVIGPDTAQAIRADELLSLSLTREQLLTAYPDWDARDIDAKLDGVASVLPEAIEGLFDDNPSWDLRDAAASLAVPTLLLTGDPAVFTLLPPAVATEVSAGNPRITAIVVAGSGHSPHRDRPEDVRRLLLGWLGGA